MKFLKLISFTPLAFALLSPAAAAEAGWHHEFEPAREIAQQDGRDLLIDFGGSDWCVPCKMLQQSILSKPAFISAAEKSFVLVEIDDLRRTKMPEGRKERYAALHKRYGIDTFPSVVLTTSDGRPYARTTYFPNIRTPEAYWEHLAPLRRRGVVLQQALVRANAMTGAAKVAALVDGLAVVPAGFVDRFYREQVAEIRALDPADTSGYQAFLAGRQAIDQLHAKIKEGEEKATAVSPGELDALASNPRMKGEALQEVHLIRSLRFMETGNYQQALAALTAMLGARETNTRFDLGDLRPWDDKSVAAVRARIQSAQNPAASKLETLRALHHVMETELPDPFEISCGYGFRAGALARLTLADAYGRELLNSTVNLEGAERLKVIGKELAGTAFVRSGALAELFSKIVAPAGKDVAHQYLPGNYRGWVR